MITNTVCRICKSLISIVSQNQTGKPYLLCNCKGEIRPDVYMKVVEQVHSNKNKFNIKNEYIKIE